MAERLRASFFAAICVPCLVVNPAVVSPGLAVSKPRRSSLVLPEAECVEYFTPFTLYLSV